ncbi:hypothetical protein F5Y13DRAFT_184469 [Hypoxylon sp. FL1857]|nr:hypothetical protein F5Y13DRAFT_184469 [Hypoxylon sp. FL1857]
MGNTSEQSLIYGDGPEKQLHVLSVPTSNAHSYSPTIDQFINYEGDAPIGVLDPSNHSQKVHKSLELYEDAFPNQTGAEKRHQHDAGADGSKRDKGKSRKSKTGSPSRPKTKYVACPFFKHNPDRYSSLETCSRRSWPAVSRLKTDHIYKHHKLTGVECRHCGTVLGTDSDHASSCIPTQFAPREGATHEMIEQLKRKAMARNQTEEEKWHAVYSILFPGIARDNHPNPCALKSYSSPALIFGAQLNRKPDLEESPGFGQVNVALFQEHIPTIVLQSAQAVNLPGDIAERFIEDLTDRMHGCLTHLQRPVVPRITLTHAPEEDGQALDEPLSDQTSQEINPYPSDNSFDVSTSSSDITGNGFAPPPAHPYAYQNLEPMLPGPSFYHSGSFTQYADSSNEAVSSFFPGADAYAGMHNSYPRNFNELNNSSVSYSHSGVGSTYEGGFNNGESSA